MTPAFRCWQRIFWVCAAVLIPAISLQAAQAGTAEMEATVTRALTNLDLAQLNLQTAALAFHGLLSFEVSGDRCNPQVFLSAPDPDQVTGSIVGTVVTPECEQPIAVSALSVGLDFKKAGTFDTLRAQLLRVCGVKHVTTSLPPQSTRKLLAAIRFGSDQAQSLQLPKMVRRRPRLPLQFSSPTCTRKPRRQPLSISVTCRCFNQGFPQPASRRRYG